MAELPRLVSAAQYAEKWGKSKATVVSWCKKGVLSRCQYVGNYMWVIDAADVPRSRYLGADEMALINSMTNVDPHTGKEKRSYPFVAPNPGRRKGYTVPSLKDLRLDQGFTQRELAGLSGVGRHVIMRGERGGKILARNVRALAKTLDVEVRDLIKPGP